MMKSKDGNSVSFIRKSSQTPLIGLFRGPEKVSVLSGLNLGLSRFCSEKAKKLLRNMPKSCSKVAQN